MLWQSGQTLKNGAYTIEKVLGQGRFSVTYLARQAIKNQFVAIKTLNPDAPMLRDLKPSEREAFAVKFYDEAVKLGQCQHPHIVRVLEVFEEKVQGWFATSRYACIVMEYIDGIDLSKRQSRQLPQTEALRYIKQVGEALQVVHQRNLLHRDIKPGNIMIRSRNGKSEAVLIDFGLARAFDHPLTTQVTVDGFAPLELYSQRQAKGPWTDVYSLAATLYVLLTGHSPECALDRHEKESTVQLTPPRCYNPKISKRVNKAIVNGLAVMPSDRTPNVTAFLRELGIRRGYVPFPDWDVNVWIQIAIAIGTIMAAIAGLIGAIVALIAFFNG